MLYGMLLAVYTLLALPNDTDLLERLAREADTIASPSATDTARLMGKYLAESLLEEDA